MKSLDLPLACALLFGNLAYVLAISSSFNLFELSRLGLAPAIILLLTILGGLAAIGVGYVSILVLGGACSLGVAGFLATVFRSQQVIEYDAHAPKSITQKVIAQTYLAYAAGIVFLLLAAIAWDLHNADGPRAGVFYPLLNALNIFLTRTSAINPIIFTINNLPLLIFLTALAGITPSLTLPYLRNFKVTSVNSGPFHTSLLITVIGLIAGITVTVTIVGFVYQVLWAGAGRVAPSFHFILLVMLGFSLHHAVGSYLGRDKTEKMIVRRLGKQSFKKRIFFGIVDVKPRLLEEPQSGARLKVPPPPTEIQSAPEKQAQ